jgi:trimethylamine:corrinoid methyltransferase-like protein
LTVSVTWWGLPAPLLIMALVQLAKTLGLPARWAGALAAALGAAGGLIVYFWGHSALAGDVVTGLAAGLSAAGLWSTVKNATHG